MLSSNRLTQGFAASLIATLAVVLGPAQAGAWNSSDGTLEIHGFLENATFFREETGLTKFRNTAQLEVAKRLGERGIFSNLEMNFIFRGTYDGVFDLNDDDYGNDSGDSQSFESIGGPVSGAPTLETPWGMSPVTTGTMGLGFGFDLANNPNEHLEILGHDLHSPGGGLTFGVPTRACDDDDRGCLHDYLDADQDELRFPEFNDRLDFIREAYIRGSVKLGNGGVFDFSFGRQQVVWGRTDLFRVLDVINPVDFSRHNIYDELEDIRIPMGILTLEYRAGARGIFEDLNFQILWKWEKFRPNHLGQGGTPYNVIDAGNFFRALGNCWDNGCTVSNFAFAELATDFPAQTIGIRDVDLPAWTIGNTDIGARFEGVIGGVGFSLNVLYYYSQFPSLRGDVESRNPFVPDGVQCQVLGGPLCEFPTEVGGDLLPRSFVPAFDIDFPRIFLLGGSADLYNDWIKTAIRIEVAYTDGEEFANTKEPELFSESDVIRWVVGLDRPTFIRFLHPRRSFLFSAQIFGQHLLDHELSSGPLGDVGMPDWDDNIIATLLIRGSYKQDRINPQIITAWDVRAQTAAIAPSVDFLISDNWRLIVGANFKVGRGAHKFDSDVTANPFPPFTCPPPGGCGASSASLGLGGYEPLSRFRAGPIGMARKENEIQVTLRYRF